jgi:FixJ family two-component response regulator
MLNNQIAYDLGISEKTVKVHRGRVMEKASIEPAAV